MKNNQQKIKGFIKQIRGISYKPHQIIEIPKEGYIPLLRATNILEGKLDLENVLYVDEALVKEEQLLQNGDILVAASSGSLKAIGKSAQFNGEGSYTFGAFCKVVRPIDIQADYLAHYFNTPNFRTTIQNQINGANIKNIKNEHIDNLSIFIPDSSKQFKIVNLLNSAKNLINKRQSQIAALDELMQSVFLEMFGDPVDNPNDLERERLGELIDVIGGYAFKSRDFIDDGIPVIKIGTANKGYFDLNTLAYLPKDYGEKYENYLIVPGDLLITLTGTVGKDDYANICEATDDYSSYLLNQRVAKLKIKSDINKQYLLYCFKQKKFKEQLTRVSRGVRQANISNDDIKKLLIPYPTLKEQEIFAEIVIKVKEQKKKLIKSQKDMEILYKSLLQRAFKGELFQNQE